MVRSSGVRSGGVRSGVCSGGVHRCRAMSGGTGIQLACIGVAFRRCEIELGLGVLQTPTILALAVGLERMGSQGLFKTGDATGCTIQCHIHHQSFEADGQCLQGGFRGTFRGSSFRVVRRQSGEEGCRLSLSITDVATEVIFTVIFPCVHSHPSFIGLPTHVRINAFDCIIFVRTTD